MFYFQRMNTIVEPTFIGDNQVWLLGQAHATRRVKGCTYYDRFTLKVNFNCSTSRPEIVLSFDRPQRYSGNPLHRLSVIITLQTTILDTVSKSVSEMR